jgi:hypothetical protein
LFLAGSAVLSSGVAHDARRLGGHRLINQAYTQLPIESNPRRFARAHPSAPVPDAYRRLDA